MIYPQLQQSLLRAFRSPRQSFIKAGEGGGQTHWSQSDSVTGYQHSIVRGTQQLSSSVMKNYIYCYVFLQHIA